MRRRRVSAVPATLAGNRVRTSETHRQLRARDVDVGALFAEQLRIGVGISPVLPQRHAIAEEMRVREVQAEAIVELPVYAAREPGPVDIGQSRRTCRISRS